MNDREQTFGVDPEAMTKLSAELRKLFESDFERQLSDYQARLLLERVIRLVGPAVYNRAVTDCAAYMSEAVTDLQAVVHAGDPSRFAEGPTTSRP